uniref:R13L1/DRL21-like LRR repeat region domain-containing protein n=1 Tax=Fagus sylvatica TaxID=28930 RepID=A0A2N9GEU2_FAGSY
MPLGLRHLTSLEILPRFVVSQEGFNAARSSCGWCKTKKATSSGGLSELKELSNLGGNLFIKDLGHGKDDMVECKATNMKEKQHLQRLELRWKRMSDRETECYDEESLEGLQPHPNLKALELWWYMGVRIPNWVSSLTNLVQLRFVSNTRLKYLPPLNKLPFLKSFFMEKMEALEYISEEEESVSNVLGGSSSSSSKTIEFFPSLSSLELRECPNLKGWWRKDYDNEPDHLLLPSFPCLSILWIINCPKLTSMPLFPYLKERLFLFGTSSKVLQQTMKMGTRQRASTATTSTSTSSSSCFPLSQLQSLDLRGVNDLESLPEEWLGTSHHYNVLKLVIGPIQHHCHHCPKLTSMPPFPYLKERLELWRVSSKVLQQTMKMGTRQRASTATTSTSTSSSSCFPLSQLQSLDLRGVNDLESLPEEWLGNLTSLQRQRCQRQTGEDWPNIAHVPYVRVDGVNQQQETIPSSS